MVERGSTAFLRQAYRNNWQRYLASLRPDTPSGWDICVLTASDERQAAVYQRQLDWRREAGLLPARTRFMVIPDPAGRRIGSGGATLRVLADLAVSGVSFDPASGERVLIIHSGGDSRRLPHCSATGKLFARVPRVLPDGRASTIFDEFLISLSGLAAEAPPGVLIASGDVLLVFDHLQLSFQRSGVIGVAAAAPAEMGTRHGVYVSEAGSHRVRAYLHKPSMAEMERWGAMQADGTVQLDTGLVWIDASTAQKLVALAQEDALAVVSGPPSAVDHATDHGAPIALNLYGDLLLPLAESTTWERYLLDTSDGPATPAVQAARRVIWKRLRGTPFTVERLQPAVFVHFGTSYEYWHTVAADQALAHLCGWTAQASAWVAPVGTPTPALPLKGEGEGGRMVCINAAVEGAIHPGPAPEKVLVVDSHLRGVFSWQGAVIVAGVHTAQPLALQADVVLHQMPVEGGFVTRVLGLRDDPKRVWDAPGATFMNRPWAEWLAAAGVTADVLWPDVPPTERTLWNARLYPVTADREEGLELALPLQSPAEASDKWRARWQAAPRLSLAESFAQADGDRILADVMAVEDYVAARRFYTAIEAEQPAAEAKALLGVVQKAVKRRCDLIAAWLAEADPILRLRGYKALAVATGDPAWEDRAFATLAAMIEAAVRRTVAR